MGEENTLKDVCNSLMNCFEQLGGSWAITITPAQFKDGSMSNFKAIGKFSFTQDDSEYCIRITKTAENEGWN